MQETLTIESGWRFIKKKLWKYKIQFILNFWLLILLKEHNKYLYAILSVTVSRRTNAQGNENDTLTFACDLSKWAPTDC